MFKLVVFDLDGTLVDSYDAIILSVNFTLKKLGIRELKYAKIKKAVGWGDKQLLLPLVGNKNIEAALKIYRKHHRRSLVEKTVFMPFAKELILYLNKKGYKLAVASNRPQRFANLLLRHLKIRKFFDYVLCKDQIKFGKPHPSILNKIMHKLSVKNQETLYAGDMAIDVLTGKRARVRTFAVTTGSSSVPELRKERPDFLAKNLGELFKIL